MAREEDGQPRPTSSACTPNCNRAAAARPDEGATPSLKSAPAPAATSRRSSRATWPHVPGGASAGNATEIMSESAAELGGYKEVVIRVLGDRSTDACDSSPAAPRATCASHESQGRSHTSAARSPCGRADEATRCNQPSDLRIDTFGPAAPRQHVNKTTARSAHPPATGIVAECQDDRSQQEQGQGHGGVDGAPRDKQHTEVPPRKPRCARADRQRCRSDRSAPTTSRKAPDRHRIN